MGTENSATRVERTGEPFLPLPFAAEFVIPKLANYPLSEPVLAAKRDPRCQNRSNHPYFQCKTRYTQSFARRVKALKC